MQPSTEVLTIQEFVGESLERCFTASTEEEAYSLLATLGRNLNASFIQKMKLAKERVSSDSILIPLPSSLGDAVATVYTNVPKEYFHEAWIFAQGSVDGLKPLGRISGVPGGNSLAAIHLRIPHRYIKEDLFLRVYFHGSTWLESSRKSWVALEYILFPKWKRERLSKAQLQKVIQGGATFYPAGIGKLSLHP